MTLDEAIKHAEEVEYQKDLESEFETDNERYAMTDIERANCKKCAEEHRQLAEWLKELKQLREQEPCEDCISRQAVLDQTYLWSKDEFLRITNPFDYLRKRINSLPPVTPQQKIGKWIFTKTIFDKYGCTVECSSCHKKWKTYDEIRWKKENKFCHNCGIKMEVEK